MIGGARVNSQGPRIPASAPLVRRSRLNRRQRADAAGVAGYGETTTAQALPDTAL